MKGHCADGRWREVFLLTTSLLPDADQFMAAFRRNVDELLAGDETVRALLAWADKKSTQAQADPLLARPSYLFLAFYSGGKFILTDNLPLAHNISRGLDLDIRLIQALDHAASLTGAINLARELGLDGLAEELTALPIPSTTANTGEQLRFANALRGLMVKHREIGRKLSLTASQEKRLADYINASRLLRDCLEVATMPPDEKRAVLDSLYVPAGRPGMSL